MNLVWFLTIGTIISIILGEFGQYPFGSSFSINLTDIFLAITLSVLAIWQIGIKKQFKLEKSFYYIILFWVWGGLSLIFANNLSGGFYLIRYILYSIAFYLGVRLVKDGGIKFERFAKIIVILGMGISTLGFLQLYFLPDLEVLSSFGYDPHKNRLVSTFLDPNFVGAFLNIPFIFCCYLFLVKRSKHLLVFLIIIGIAILLTFSRSAYLMLLVESFILGFLKIRKIIIVVLMVIFLSYFLIPRFSERINGALSFDKTATERIESWKKGMLIFSENPGSGVGFNNIRQAYLKNNLLKVFSEDGGNSGSGVDSSLIFVLATTGGIGLVIYLTFWGAIIKLFKLSDLRSVVLFSLIAGLFIDSLFINSLFFTPIILVIYLSLGIFYGSDK